MVWPQLKDGKSFITDEQFDKLEANIYRVNPEALRIEPSKWPLKNETLTSISIKKFMLKIKFKG